MSHDRSAPACADARARSDGVEEAIAAVVTAAESASSDVIAVRGPDADLASTTAHLNRQWDDIRGRGGVYPVLYSGRGRGALAEMIDGSVKYDFITGIGVHPFGHGDPDLMRVALQGATSSTLMEGNLQASPDAVAFAASLLEHAGVESGLIHAFLCTSGALANETALKVCMQKRSGAPRVMAFARCFAGRTTTMCQIGDSAGARDGVAMTQMVDYVPFFDGRDPDGSTAAACAAVAKHLKRYPDQHACFVAELVQGEGGVNLAPREFFAAIFELCRDADLPVWVDEIQTFGRTRELYAFQWLGLHDFVDVVTVGKLSQVCACLYTGDMNPRPGLLSGTFIGSAPAIRVGHRIVERLVEEGTYGAEGRNVRLSESFQSRCRTLVDRHGDWFEPVAPSARRGCTGVGSYGGVGGMQRLTPFGGEPSAIKASVKALYDRGVLCLQAGHGPLHLRFLLPFGVVTEEELDGAFAIIEAGLGEVARQRNEL